VTVRSATCAGRLISHNYMSMGPLSVGPSRSGNAN
jgi:hypothetical protein